jgi:hypothetical protein
MGGFNLLVLIRKASSCAFWITSWLFIVKLFRFMITLLSFLETDEYRFRFKLQTNYNPLS